LRVQVDKLYQGLKKFGDAAAHHSSFNRDYGALLSTLYPTKDKKTPPVMKIEHAHQ
jgi:hypothetical protein